MNGANAFQKSILDTLDKFLHKNDYASAESYLRECIVRVAEQQDSATELMLYNELMGLCRKVGKRDDALSAVDMALKKIEEMSVETQVGSATTYLNSATVYKAFGMPEKSLPLFEKAKSIYEEKLSADDERLGGLYNNMALTLVDLKMFREANILYERAIAIMKNKPLEIAMTYLNKANAVEAEIGLLESCEAVSDYLSRAKTLLEGYQNRDGYYAFVCEKCASVYGYFGDFLYDEELCLRARRIYEGS